MQKKIKKNNFNVIVIVLLIVNLVIGLLALGSSFLNSWKQAIESIESRKVGGQENYELLKEYYESDSYKAQQKSALQQVLNQKPAVLPESANAKPAPAKWVESSKELKKVFEDIIDDSYIVGDKKARFTILEYSELLCPFCKRHHNAWTLDAVMKKFPKDVNTSYRHFIVHQPAEQFALWAECVKDQKGIDGFNAFIDEMFSATSVNTSSVSDTIKKLWLDEDEFNKCVSDEVHKDRVNAQTQEWRSLFGVKWTPGNVILDRETGKFVLIPGAYPTEKFIQEIEKLLK